MVRASTETEGVAGYHAGELLEVTPTRASSENCPTATLHTTLISIPKNGQGIAGDIVERKSVAGT